MDRIRVNGLTLQIRIGVPREERRRPQLVILDLEMQLDLDKASLSDDIAHTLDYSRLVRRLQSRLEAQEFRLLESAADRACRLVLEEERVRRVTVTARKFPASLTDRLESVAVVRRLDR